MPVPDAQADTAVRYHVSRWLPPGLRVGVLFFIEIFLINKHQQQPRISIPLFPAQ
tara:strand:+ start:109 stop:273 length:165 start_codon:yes stop_codon:yes gene_type:complete